MRYLWCLHGYNDRKIPAHTGNALIMNIVVITADKYLPNEHDIIHSMFGEGLERLHVRKANLTIAEMRNYITQIDKSHHHKLVIHRHHLLHQELGLGGLHLSSFDRASPTTVAAFRNLPAEEVSTSIHSWNELKELPFECSYVFISPVFNSISKPGYSAGVELQELSRIRKASADFNSLPRVYGLGGIDSKNAVVLKQHGFDGAAVLGSLWMDPDPIAAFRKLRSSIGENFG